MIWTSLIAQGKRRLVMSFLLATFVALLYLHLARFYQGRISSWILAALAIPVLLNLLRAGAGLAYRLDRHPFRRLDLGLHEDQVAPGGSLELELVLEARRSATLARLSTELRATRLQTNAGGRQRSVLHRETRSLEQGLQLEPGVSRSYKVNFPLPSNAPYSFRSMEGKISWILRVEAEVLDWGSLEDELEVTVGPT
jgi:hypothetical protein